MDSVNIIKQAMYEIFACHSFTHRNTHVDKEKEVTEQVDGVNRNPAEKEYDSYAPQ